MARYSPFTDKKHRMKRHGIFDPVRRGYRAYYVNSFGDCIHLPLPVFLVLRSYRSFWLWWVVNISAPNSRLRRFLRLFFRDLRWWWQGFRGRR
jgi:hypothetical protein